MNLEARNKFATVVKTLRGDMSKSAFAKTLGVSHTAISNWEDSLHIPDSKALGCTLCGKFTSGYPNFSPQG